MKKILVGVDGSEPALKGVRMAAELARSSGARLELAYISPPNLLPRHLYADAVRKLEEQEATYAREILQRAALEARAQEVGCDEVTRTGAAAETLAELAEGPDVWLVAVGSRGRGAVSRVLLGSVADRLVQVCRKPVLVVR